MKMREFTTLRTLLEKVPSRLAKLPEGETEKRPSQTKWSPKEELGHLIDSAANNHQRIVRVQMTEGLAMPGYEQNRWVELHRYQQRDWDELIALWRFLNQQLLAAAESVPETAWAHTCTVADSEPLTLRFVFEDYLRHMLHHLEHIGIPVGDFRN